MSRKLFIVVNNDFFFISHRLQIGIAALKHGYDVTIVSKNTGRKKEIESYGLKFKHIKFNRSKTDVIFKLLNIYSLYRLYKREKPDIIHHVTIYCCILGSFAAKLAKSKNVVNAISGGGYNFSNDRNGILQKILRAFMQLCFSSPKYHYILQNKDDFIAFMNYNNASSSENYHLIKGSGVNLNEFSYHEPVKKDKLQVLLPARILLDKGIIEFIEAAKILKDEFQDSVEFIIMGYFDKKNGARISKKKLLRLIDNKYIRWHDFSKEIIRHLANSDIVVLPSYREGLPKSIIDACAIGRPIVTTDAYGCRDCVVEGYNGYIVPVKNSEALAEKIKLLLEDEQSRIRMGKNARLFAEQNFSIDKVVDEHLKIYNEVQQLSYKVTTKNAEKSKHPNTNTTEDKPLYILSFDIEQWFDILGYKDKDRNVDINKEENRKRDRKILYDTMDVIFDGLEKYNHKATFFVVGALAKQYPDLIRKISEKYEVGSHSMNHGLVYKMEKKEFRTDLLDSIHTIEDIIGKKVRCYRAPGLSIHNEQSWTFDMMSEAGIEIDSSLTNVALASYGNFRNVAKEPFILRHNGIEIKEMPAVSKYPILFSAGGYFRFLNYGTIKHMTKRSDYIMAYFHPRDFTANQPMLSDISLVRKFKSYYGLREQAHKFDKGLSDFTFADIDQANRMIDWAKVPKLDV